MVKRGYVRIRALPAALMLLLVACGSGTDPVPAQPTPNIASTTEAGVQTTAIATVETMVQVAPSPASPALTAVINTTPMPAEPSTKLPTSEKSGTWSTRYLESISACLSRALGEERA